MDIDNEAGSAPAEANDDLRSVLAASLAEHAEPSTAASAPEADRPAVERNRDAGGRFAPKAEGETPAASEAAKPDATQAPTETAPAATRKAPSAWKTDHHEAFGRLDPAIQDYILEREREVQKGFEERAPKVRTAEEFERVLSPHADLFSKYGLSHAQGIERLLQAQAMLERDPLGALRQLAAQYRVNLGAQPQQPGAAPPAQRSPEADRLQRVEGSLQTLLDQQNRREQQSMLSEIEKFKADKPHFEAVRPAMAELVKSGQAKDLADAYDKAVWLDPTIRESLISARSASAEAAAAEKAKADQAAVERARSASVSVKGAPNSGAAAAASAPKATLREELAAAYASMRG